MHLLRIYTENSVTIILPTRKSVLGDSDKVNHKPEASKLSEIGLKT